MTSHSSFSQPALCHQESALKKLNKKVTEFSSYGTTIIIIVIIILIIIISISIIIIALRTKHPVLLLVIVTAHIVEFVKLDERR